MAENDVEGYDEFAGTALTFFCVQDTLVLFDASMVIFSEIKGTHVFHLLQFIRNLQNILKFY